MISKLFAAMLTIVVGVVLIPVVLESVVNVVYTDGNTSTPATLPTGVSALLNIVPLLFVIIIIAGVVGYVAYNRR